MEFENYTSTSNLNTNAKRIIEFSSSIIKSKEKFKLSRNY